MNLSASIIKRKFATAVLITASVAAFATLGGDGRRRGTKGENVTFKFGVKNFSLHSTYNYKGNNLLIAPDRTKFIMLNTVVTYQKGNATYIVPLKRKVILDKIKFNPAPVKF